MKEKKPNFTSKNTGILLISHGSRHPIASETFNKIADMFRTETDFKVNVGYMEIHKPNIPRAINELVEDTEINTIIAVPVFLAHGIHTTQDIPKILGLNKEDNESEDHHNHNNEPHKHHHNGNEHQKDKHNHHGNGHHHHHDLEKTNFNGKIIYTEPLGADPLLIEIIKNRVNTALKK
jgi:sirohydrochlorin cobaltochelatase